MREALMKSVHKKVMAIGFLLAMIAMLVFIVLQS